MSIIEISCREVRRELSNYVDDEVSPELRESIKRHVEHCKGCRALFDGVNNILRLVSTGDLLKLPLGFSERLRKRVTAAGKSF